MDDPLETSNVSFDDDVIIHRYSEEDRRLRDFFNVCSFGDVDCLQFLPYSVLESYFAISRRSAFMLMGMVLEPQSGETMDAPVSAGLTTFGDDAPGFEATYMSARDDTYYVADDAEFDIHHFFSRPVRIYNSAWTVGVPWTFVALPVFKAFWENKRVVNRAANYRNMKCDMCVKILINGTPFHYGMLQASIQPDTRFDDLVNTDGTELGCVRGSQLPHILVDPTSSTGGCLRLPYLHSFNSYNLSAVDLQFAGTLQIRELVQLAHVSGVSEPVTVTVMAWAENVVLGAPTFNAPTGLVPQSGDEYGQGIVSRPAFILAKIAGSLSRVPYIGPYAMATQTAASVTAVAAQAHGFVKPAIVTDFSLVNPRHVPNFCSTTQHDPIYKATLDDKQEVTVDPRVVGLTGEDEMSILSLAKRETYMAQFPWNQTSLPDTRLWATQVHPCMMRANGTGLNTQYLQSPSSWVSQAFKYWRGTTRFRFTAVASTFHRGRIRIVYEPGVAVPSVLNEFNTNLSHVWDLGESKEVVIDVGWHSNIPYLETPFPGDSVPFSATLPVNNPIVSGTNGSLTLYVLNELTAPDTNLASPVTILMSTSMCDDFELFDPDEAISVLNYFPQSGTMLEEEHISPNRKGPDVTFGCGIKIDATPAIFHGDPVVSIRTLLKRYCYSTPFGGQTPLTGGFTHFRFTLPSFPLHKGRAPNAIHSATTPFNFVGTTYLNYFTPGFLARRGGIRHRYIFSGTAKAEWATVSRLPITNRYTAAITQLTGATASGIASDAANQSFAGRNGLAGSMTVNNVADTGLDMEVPFHSRRRYFPGRAMNSERPDIDAEGLSVSFRVNNEVAAAKNVAVASFVSAADDFSLAGFIDVPIMYYHPTLPPPT